MVDPEWRLRMSTDLALHRVATAPMESRDSR